MYNLATFMTLKNFSPYGEGCFHPASKLAGIQQPFFINYVLKKDEAIKWVRRDSSACGYNENTKTANIKHGSYSGIIIFKQLYNLTAHAKTY